jgi:hypothetical protein
VCIRSLRADKRDKSMIRLSANAVQWCPSDQGVLKVTIDGAFNVKLGKLQ